MHTVMIPFLTPFDPIRDIYLKHRRTTYQWIPLLFFYNSVSFTVFAVFISTRTISILYRYRFS